MRGHKYRIPGNEVRLWEVRAFSSIPHDEETNAEDKLEKGIGEYLEV